MVWRRVNMAAVKIAKGSRLQTSVISWKKRGRQDAEANKLLK